MKIDVGRRTEAAIRESEPKNVYYTTEFKGHCPVGTAAVIVARDRGHALRLLRAALADANLLTDKNARLTKEIFRKVDPRKTGATILQDGDY